MQAHVYYQSIGPHDLLVLSPFLLLHAAPLTAWTLLPNVDLLHHEHCALLPAVGLPLQCKPVDKAHTTIDLVLQHGVNDMQQQASRVPCPIV